MNKEPCHVTDCENTGMRCDICGTVLCTDHAVLHACLEQCWCCGKYYDPNDGPDAGDCRCERDMSTPDRCWTHHRQLDADGVIWGFDPDGPLDNRYALTES